MRPLMVGPKEEAQLRAVKEYAELHPISLDMLREAMTTGVQYTLDPGFRTVLPVGFRVVFTIECHPGERWCRHLSVSLADAQPGILPNMQAMKLIGRSLGMRMSPFDPITETYFEGPEDAPPRAVSVIEPMTKECHAGPTSVPDLPGRS